MGGKSTPSAPNLQPIANAQLQIAQQSDQLAQQQLGISQDQFAYMQQQGNAELSLAQQQQQENEQYQNQAMQIYQQTQGTANQVAQAQLSAMQQEQGWAEQANQRYNQVGIPLQNQYIQQAQQFGTQGYQNQQAASAQADVQSQADAQTQNAVMGLESMGIDPSQIQSTSMVNQYNAANAANAALAGNQARLQAQQTGMNYLGQAANMVSGLPAQALGEMSSGSATGSSAISSEQGALGSLGAASQFGGTGINELEGALSNYSSLTGSPMQWASMGMNSMGMSGNMYGNAASTENQQFADQMSAWNAGQQASNNALSTIGQVAGIASMAMMAEGGDVDDYDSMSPADQVAQDADNSTTFSQRYADWRQSNADAVKGALDSAFGGDDNRQAISAGLSALSGLGQHQQQYNDSVQNVLRNNPNPQFHAEGGAIKLPVFKPQRIPAAGIPKATVSAPKPNIIKPHQWMAGNGRAGGALPLPVKRAWASNPDTQRIAKRQGISQNFAEGGSVQMPSMAPAQRMQSNQMMGAMPGAQRMSMPTMGNGGPNNRIWGQNSQPRRMFAEGGAAIGTPGVGGGGASMPGTGNSMGTGQYAQRPPVPMQPITAVPMPQSRDRIPAMLSAGEYVIPADVVRAVGLKHLDGMVKKYHRPGA